MKSCPNCQNRVLQVTQTPETNVLLDICPSCSGTWFDEDDLGDLVGNPRSVKLKVEQALRSPATSEKVSPVSGKPMLEIPYRGKIPVYYCEESKGIWVEQSELRAVLGG